LKTFSQHHLGNIVVYSAPDQAVVVQKTNFDFVKELKNAAEKKNKAQ
jgi:hypothetical protein